MTTKEIKHTDPAMVKTIVTDLNPPVAYSSTGYGSDLPTRYRVKYGTRWHRVYVVIYGNAGSAYIKKGGEWLFLDIATEYAIQAGLNDPKLGVNQ